MTVRGYSGNDLSGDSRGVFERWLEKDGSCDGETKRRLKEENVSVEVKVVI